MAEKETHVEASGYKNRLSLRDWGDWRTLSRERRAHPDVSLETPLTTSKREVEIERLNQHGIEGIHLYFA